MKNDYLGILKDKKRLMCAWEKFPGEYDRLKIRFKNGLDGEYFIKDDKAYIYLEPSNEKKDWTMINFNFKSVTTDKELAIRSRSHKGFNNTADMLIDMIGELVEDKKIIIAGYSSGAGVSVEFMKKFHKHNNKIQVITFGCPPSNYPNKSSKASNEYYKDIDDKCHFRIVSGHDAVSTSFLYKVNGLAHLNAPYVVFETGNRIMKRYKDHAPDTYRECLLGFAGDITLKELIKLV